MIKSEHCSFCAKSADEVEHLVAGPAVWICPECTDLCSVIFAEHRGRRLRAKILSNELDEIRRHGT